MKPVISLARTASNRLLTGLDYIFSLACHELRRPTKLGTFDGRLGQLRWSRELTTPQVSGQYLICIFVLYATESSLSTISYLKALRGAGFEILVINNRTCSDGLIHKLSSICWRIYDRSNIGRDIGAYKDGILKLQSENILHQCKALCLANDSTMFIPGVYGDSFTDSIRNFLAGPASALFSHESHQITKHYQSFFQILKSDVITSRAFIRFWKEYRPLSHRHHCIHKGEVKSSEAIYNKISRCQVLYTSESLLEALGKRPPGSLPAERILAMMPSITYTMQGKRRPYSLEKMVAAAIDGDSVGELNQHYLAELVEASNPSHVAAFLYPRFLHCPLVKRDLCLAGSFSIGKALQLFREELFLSGVVEQEIEARVAEFRAAITIKGIPADFRNKPWKRALKGVPDGFTYTGP